MTTLEDFFQWYRARHLADAALNAFLEDSRIPLPKKPQTKFIPEPCKVKPLPTTAEKDGELYGSAAYLSALCRLSPAMTYLVIKHANVRKWRLGEGTVGCLYHIADFEGVVLRWGE